MKTFNIGALVSLVLLPSAISIFAQGSLTPPGAPAATFKTLQQIEPRFDLQMAPAGAVDTTDPNYQFIINATGSYYLSSSVVTAKQKGIKVVAQGVTLDLNGFAVVRQGAPASTIGIEIVSTAHRVTVVNGTIRDFGTGISSDATASRGCRFYALNFTNTSSVSLITGTAAVVDSCRIENASGTWGISAGDGSLITNCTITFGNFFTAALNTNNGCIISHCIVANNIATIAIHLGAAGTIVDCVASNNTSNGSSSTGISASGDSAIIHCNSSQNKSTAGSLNNTTGVGFFITDGCTIQGCNASENQGDGIRVTQDCSVRDNHCYANGAVGIEASGDLNRIQNNDALNNAKGISVLGSGNLIDGNHVRNNSGFGIEVTTATAKNVIMRNEAGNNVGSYSGIAAGNQMAPTGDPSTSTNPFINILN